MTPATFALYLTVLAVAIKFLLGALQSGTFNSVLQKFSLPPIPTAIFPWAGAVLGLAGGIVSGLQQGDTFQVALAKALLASLSGGIAAMHLEFVSGRPPVTSAPPAPPGSRIEKKLAAVDRSEEITVSTVPTVPPPPPRTPPPPPPAPAAARWTYSPRAAQGVWTDRAFRPLRTILVAGLLGAVVSCAWWKGEEPTIVQYTEADAACVLGQLFGTGAFSPPAIVLACAPVTLAQVVAILASLVNFYVNPADAGGATSAGEVCGVGPPPIRGAPACIPHETLLRLQAMHEAAKAELAAGSK
jgi:hypothetical protein